VSFELRRVARPGWYGIGVNWDKVLGRSNLFDMFKRLKFEVVYSYMYFYVKVTEENSRLFVQKTEGVHYLRLKDIDAERIIDIFRANRAVRRYKNGTREEGSFTKDQLLDVLMKYQNGLCLGCSKNIVGCFTVDHIIPQSRGGSDHIDNIQLLCGPCNSSKNDRDMEEWALIKNIEAKFVREIEVPKPLTDEELHPPVSVVGPRRRSIRRLQAMQADMDFP
jgi:5-methylcytosine-specific restriction endonuclease McrA